MLVNARATLLNVADNRVRYATELLQVGPPPDALALYHMRNRALMACGLLRSALALTKLAATKTSPAILR